VGTVTTTYAYNAMGQRTRKFSSTGNASTVIFVYDTQGRLLGEYDNAGTAIREVVWLNDEPVAMFTPATPLPTVYYIHNDHIQTPRIVTDRSSNLRWTWMAEPFGTTAPNTNPAGLGALTFNLRHPGQFADAESGLFYNYFRDYDSTSGRYVQSDPIGLAGGINTYLYANASPLMYADPNGLNPYTWPYICSQMGFGSLCGSSPQPLPPITQFLCKCKGGDGGGYAPPGAGGTPNMSSYGNSAAAGSLGTAAAGSVVGIYAVAQGGAAHSVLAHEVALVGARGLVFIPMAVGDATFAAAVAGFAAGAVVGIGIAVVGGVAYYFISDYCNNHCKECAK
jgi:RHS repeat-associated protein